MSFTLDKIFTTVTAIGSNKIIKEVSPCNALKPYVRCFWEADPCHEDTELRIIPDCCADILFHSENGSIHSDFCGVSNHSFVSKGNTKTFGIRFYAWSVNLFSSRNMSGTLNRYLPADAVFENLQKLAIAINNSVTLKERIDVAQKYLIDRLCYSRQNSDIMNSLFMIISQNANVKVKSLSEYCAVSGRTLERSFRTSTGLSPKEMIELIQYQLLWQECFKPDFNVLDCVDKFGFYDCPHLYKSFKKFHGITLPEAVKSL